MLFAFKMFLKYLLLRYVYGYEWYVYKHTIGNAQMFLNVVYQKYCVPGYSEKGGHFWHAAFPF